MPIDGMVEGGTAFACPKHGNGLWANRTTMNNRNCLIFRERAVMALGPGGFLLCGYKITSIKNAPPCPPTCSHSDVSDSVRHNW